MTRATVTPASRVRALRVEVNGLRAALKCLEGWYDERTQQRNELLAALKAIPVAVDHMGGLNFGKGCTSLRDYFAGQALHAFIVAAHAAPGETEAVGIAGDAYDMADAMLATREVSHGA